MKSSLRLRSVKHRSKKTTAHPATAPRTVDQVNKLKYDKDIIRAADFVSPTDKGYKK